MAEVKFGWRVPAFPLDESRRSTFMDQINQTLEKVQGNFDSAWVAEQLRHFTDLGVEYFVLRFADFPNTAGVELFMEQVIPQLKSA